jgi:hypothetical protein
MAATLAIGQGKPRSWRAEGQPALRRRLRPRGGRGRGPPGPGTHLELTGEVDGTGGGPAAANLAAEVVSFR